MIYKEYGSSGLKVSAIGFGGMRFDLTQDEGKHIDLIRYGYEKGINYFDTAPGYCDDRSEVWFGKALSVLPREKIVISTKLMPESVKSKTDALDKIKRSCERLQSPYIDIFHAWNFRTMDHYRNCIRPDGLYEAMLQAQADGLIKHLAFSTHLTGDKAAEVIESDKFDGVLLGFNIMNFPYRLPAVLAAKKRGMGIAAMNTLYGGLIAQYPEKFAFIAQDGESPVMAALRFNAGLELLDVALNGFTTFEHIDMACQAADNARKITADELDKYAEIIGSGMEGYCTGCGYCKACPAKIAVPVMMQFYNYKLLENATDEAMAAKLKSNKVWGILPENQTPAQSCLNCRYCEKCCTQHLPITERLREIAAWEKAAANLQGE